MTIHDKVEKLLSLYGSPEMLAARLSVTTMAIRKWTINKIIPRLVHRRGIELLYRRNFEDKQ
jgi:hypothetical protein